MKHLAEYRDSYLVKSYLEEIKKVVTRSWTIMEICGGQTHGLVKNGILDILPKEIEMVHGPGCPVCVTPISIIDQAISLARKDNIILCSFGDMLRVPGSEMNLLEARAQGGDVRILYSPLEAVEVAKRNPEKEVVFFAVGFETTAPANALSVLQAKAQNIKNYSILTSHVKVPPAIDLIMSDKDCKIQGFLAAGHVCTIMGNQDYYPICKKYKIPMVVTGLESVDLMQGILMLVQQLENGESRLESQYSRIAKESGNIEAQKIISEVFEVSDRDWRGLGTIPSSGYELREKYSAFDANRIFKTTLGESIENPACIAGQILKGLKKPFECPEFGTSCTPEFPLGAPMVSSEGACAAYFNYHKMQSNEVPT